MPALPEAERLAALAASVRWPLPSSSGDPVGKLRALPDDIAVLAATQDRLPAAVAVLLDAGHEERAVELAAAAWRLWILSRDLEGGRALLAPLLPLAKRLATPAAAEVLYGDGLFAFWQGDRAASQSRNAEALAIARHCDDPRVKALAHLGLSRVGIEEGHHRDALEHARCARRFAAEVSREMGQAPLHMEAQAWRGLGDYDTAALLFTESLALNRELGDEGMMVVELHNLGHVHTHRGDVEAARTAFARCEALGGGDDPYAAAMTVLNSAAIAYLDGDGDRAAGLLGDVDARFAAMGMSPAVDDAAEIHWLRSRLDQR